MALLTIDGVPLPSPVEGGYKVKSSDLDSENTTRDETGGLHRDRVRSGVYRIDITWKINGAEYLIVVKALKPAKFMVVFFDPNTGAYKTADMYAGDREGNLISYSKSPDGCLWELSCSLVQF